MERNYSMEILYKHIGKTRQAIYSANQRFKKQQNTEKSLLSLVRYWRDSHPQMGARVLYHTLKNKGVAIPIGINAFENLLSKNGLQAQMLKRFVPLTSDGKGKSNYPNLTNGLVLNNVYQLIVADITYFWLCDRWAHLFVVKDVYSQRLLGLYPSWDMKAESAIKALNQALSTQPKERFVNCIHHSDNGSQYHSKRYRKLLDSYQIKISRAKSCKENGSCEQMHHIIKNMYLRHFAPNSMEALIKACQKVKRLLNNERAIAALGYKTVKDFESKISMMNPNKRPKKELYDFNQK